MAFITYLIKELYMTRKKIFVCLVSMLILLLAIIVVCNVIVNVNASGKTYNTIDDVPHCNIAVLLGTGPTSRYSKGPNMFYWNRIYASAYLYKKEKFDTLIISGTKRPGYNEPLIMKRDLMKEDIPSNIIVLDENGSNTYLSMANLKTIYKEDSAIIISQKWHNQRAIYIADHIGINAIGYNAEDSNTLTAQITHFRELLARVKLFLTIMVN